MKILLRWIGNVGFLIAFINSKEILELPSGRVAVWLTTKRTVGEVAGWPGGCQETGRSQAPGGRPGGSVAGLPAFGTGAKWLGGHPRELPIKAIPKIPEIPEIPKNHEIPKIPIGLGGRPVR